MARRRKSDTEAIIKSAALLFAIAVFFISSKTGFSVSQIIFATVALVCVGALAFVAWKLFRNPPPPPPSFHSFESTSTSAPTELTVPERLRSIDWFQFEKLVALIYEQKGYQVERLGGAKPDGGVDLKLEKNGEQIVVQCKHWKSWQVRIRDIREFLGTLADTKISKGIFVTLQGYTNDARELASKHGIEIIDESALLQMIRDPNGQISPRILALLNDTRKVCPKCESDLVLRTAERGINAGNQFWGCSTYPRCRFTMKIAESA